MTGVGAFLAGEGIDLLEQRRILDLIAEVHHAAHEEILARRECGEQGVKELRSEWIVAEPVAWGGVGDIESHRPGLDAVLDRWRAQGA
jgi:hypothetical protein